MTFSDPILAGDQLIRNAIQSEDYVPGVSGWRIEKNGVAEFNNLTARGELDVGGGIAGRTHIYYDEATLETQIDMWIGQANIDASLGTVPTVTEFVPGFFKRDVNAIERRPVTRISSGSWDGHSSAELLVQGESDDTATYGTGAIISLDAPHVTLGPFSGTADILLKGGNVDIEGTILHTNMTPGITENIIFTDRTTTSTTFSKSVSTGDMDGFTVGASRRGWLWVNLKIQGYCEASGNFAFSFSIHNGTSDAAPVVETAQDSNGVSFRFVSGVTSTETKSARVLIKGLPTSGTLFVQPVCRATSGTGIGHLFRWEVSAEPVL